MIDREAIEEQIRMLLATETRAIVLSNKLFSQEDGLFGLLGPTIEDRRVIIQSPLFRQALARLSELEREEAEEFRRKVEAYKASRRLYAGGL